MNSFGPSFQPLVRTAVEEIGRDGQVSIDTALALMSAGVDPRNIVAAEESVVALITETN